MIALEAVRVLVVDDHVLVADGTRQLLDAEEDLEVVGQAGTVADALEIIERLSPAVAIVDLNLPDGSGLDLARAVVGDGRKTAVLIVTAYDDYAYVAEALDVGVAGYLLKTASARELVDAVRAAANGVFVLDRAVSGRLARRLRSAPSGTGRLTGRESDVLRLLAQGLANKVIAGELGLGVRTVEGHVSSLLSKLGVGSRTEAVLYALSHHLVEPPGRVASAPGEPVVGGLQGAVPAP